MNDQAVLFAVSKLLKPKFDPTTGATVVKGQVVVDVDAVISKSPDELYAPTVHIPYLKVFAEFAKLSGITRNVALKNFRTAMVNSLTNGTDAEAELDNLVDELDKFENIVKEEVINQLPKQTRKGKVSVKGSAEIASVSLAEAV